MNEAEATALRLPRGADATARRWLEAGAPPGGTPVVAASVCLLRDAPPAGGPAVEVLWLTRGQRLATWPGLLAFPGGAVEAVDRTRRPDDAGPPDRLTVLARAAARECAEETGTAVAARGLRGFARWVTPEHEPRRFDTTFLVGVLPPGEVPGAAPVGPEEETDAHGWARPASLLEDVLAGRRQALPPTRAVLRALAVAGRASAGETADAVAAAGSLVPVVPRAVWHDGPLAEDGLQDVDLVLPRHAGEVP